MYNNFLEKIIIPLGDFLNKSTFKKDLIKWRNIDQLNTLELEVLQKNNLFKILTHAVNNTKLYNHIELVEKNPYKSLKEFPVLTKEKLRESTDKLITENIKKLTKISSSGSSGVSSSVYMNSRDLSTLRAGLIHWWEWYGYKLGNPIIQTGISPNRGFLKKTKDYLFRTIYVSAFAHSEVQILTILQKISKKKYYILVGYASSLNVFANVAENNNLNIQFKSVISLGDKLFNHYRKNIEKTFKCKIYDTYGSAEGFLIGAEFDLPFMYILSPQCYIEILDDNDNPVPNGIMGNIVVTRLDGFAMPLIRYKIGDLGILLPKEKYPINRKFNYPLLQQIVGRDTDIVKTKNGKTLVVHSFTGVFEYISDIKQFKVVQKSLDGILIEYIKAESFNKNILPTITNKLQQSIQDNSFKIDYKEVKSILPSKSGKPQIIKSYL
ncbi:hypothetical protein [Polaribacter cellanae]|uniref:Phenylacetate--CoA ligase family protein n=1 Tax=Polaribacter cellanae TaxID=2818493 RepID=A0A975CQV3_9FLAO|nr:hypothetical protein [Polaribacter cellanae]QTE23060.1 hypothetical protein J3359_01945 [Polaribacter cellanae]